MAIDDPVELCVSLSGCAKTAKRIDVLFSVESFGDKKQTGPYPAMTREELGEMEKFFIVKYINIDFPTHSPDGVKNLMRPLSSYFGFCFELMTTTF